MTAAAENFIKEWLIPGLTRWEEESRRLAGHSALELGKMTAYQMILDDLEQERDKWQSQAAPDWGRYDELFDTKQAIDKSKYPVMPALETDENGHVRVKQPDKPPIEPLNLYAEFNFDQTHSKTPSCFEILAIQNTVNEIVARLAEKGI